jgi:hypothetical protein
MTTPSNDKSKEEYRENDLTVYLIEQYKNHFQ